VELGTIVGLISGVVLVFTTIFLGGEMSSFIDIASFLVVIGGAIAATFVAIPFSDVLSVVNITRNAFFGKNIDYIQVIEIVVDLAKKARREGLLAVDKEVAKIENEFLKNGMEMVVDGTEPELIKKVMNTELSYLMDRHAKGQALYSTLGAYAPAFGMIGTLIGLIAMLQNLDDPAAIGPGMAVALITTFYGALMANLVFLPMATKLSNMSGSEILEKEMIIEGVLAIQYGEHPNTISRKLLNFIPPKLREDFNDEAH
jgi:chemotaxis protein MotA